MKILKILLVLVILVLVVLIAGAVYLNHYIQTPAFKDKVLAAAREAMGSKVEISELKISILSGVTLRGVRVENPQGFPGDLLSADAFVLRYRLLPLLRKRLEVQQLSLERPKLTLVRNAKEQWNYEFVGGKSPEAAAPKPAAEPAPTSSATEVRLNIALEKLSVDSGEISMMSEENKLLARLEGVNVASAVNVTDGKLSGDGEARVEALNVSDFLFCRNLTAPLSYAADSVTLKPLAGKLADGDLSGEAGARLTGGFKYSLNVQVKDASVEKMLAEAKTKPLLNGKMQATAVLEGTGGLPTIKGNGRVEIVGGKLGGIPLQQLLAAVLVMPELREIAFDECLIEFTMGDNKMPTPVIKLTSSRIKVTGQGVVSIEDFSLNHDLTLAVSRDMVSRLPNEIRAAFVEQPDGFLVLNFRVWGPYDAPKTDIAEKIARGAAGKLLEKGLEKLFK